MSSVINQIENKYRKAAVVDVKSGDTVRVHQKIREGNKERIQVFEGLVIRTDRAGSHTASITVRRTTGGLGVEKSYLLHSPLVTKVEVVKRSKVRRNYLTYMRARTGKSARLSAVDFDKQAVNDVHDQKAEAAEEKLHEQAQAEHQAAAEKTEDKAEAKATDKTEDKAEAKATDKTEDKADSKAQAPAEESKNQAKD